MYQLPQIIDVFVSNVKHSKISVLVLMRSNASLLSDFLSGVRDTISARFNEVFECDDAVLNYIIHEIGIQ